MISDNKPILFNAPVEFDEIEIYFVHDIHYGSELHDNKRWERFKREIQERPNRYVIWVGDYCETALINSKSDIYSQTQNIETQRIWMQQQFSDLKSHTLAVVPGNHENRITKIAGLFPVYDAAVCADIQDKYRQHYAFIDIGVGLNYKGKNKQVHYVGFIAHKMRDCKNYQSSDFVEGIDFAAFGHDHDPKDHARSRIGFDSKTKTVYHRDIEVLNSGSFLNYGGYGAEAGYRPQATKLYKIVLSGKSKDIKTIGYHI